MEAAKTVKRTHQRFSYLIMKGIWSWVAFVCR